MDKEEFSQKLSEAMKCEAEIERPPMFHELMVSGADEETAMFVARILRKNGYYLVNPDDIGWPEIRGFQEDLRRGQDYREDAGGFFMRCIWRLLGQQNERDEVVTNQMAAKRLLQRIDLD